MAQLMHEEHDVGMSGGDGDQDHGGDREVFFHCLDRVPSGMHIDVDFPSDDDDDDEDDVRVSFVSAMGDQSFRKYQADVLEELQEVEEVREVEELHEEVDKSKYDMWMSDEPMSIQERRRLLHQGLGMNSSRDLALRRFSTKKRAVDAPRTVSRRLPPMPSTAAALPPSGAAAAAARDVLRQLPAEPITRRRSDSFLAVAGDGGASGSGKQPCLRRARSLPSPHDPCCSALADKFKAAATSGMPAAPQPAGSPAGEAAKGDGGGKKQDSNGKEAAAQTGVQMGLEFIGNMKYLMRRGPSQLPPSGSAAPKGDKSAGKKKGGWLKNIKSVAIGFIGDNSGPASAGAPLASPNPEKLKVHNYGKSSKDLTGLYMSQEISAHDGAIWSIKFSADGRRLASGGEDGVVRVWEVVETSTPPCSVAQDGSLPPLAPGSAAEGSSSPAKPPAQLGRKLTLKSGMGGIRSRSGRYTLPEHLVVPEKVFALAEQPLCVLEGHEDEVLDLTWSKSEQLLSSSMDKTVRLWDTESKACLKTFSHSDYVTCIQFNPVDDDYFISGSLDAKVRLWSIPNRQVVDWTDINEMVTSASYSPDGQSAIFGTHTGSCRLYKIEDSKLSHEAQIDIMNKKRKSQAKKITGFHFSPGSPSEVLVTSADSQIRVFDGVAMVQKFRGFKNTSSQISAAYTSDGRYVVCPSEDSHVYLWRTTRSAPPPPSAIGAIGMTKPKTWCTTRSYENFYCKDVCAAIPWQHSPSLPGEGSQQPRDGGSSKPGVTCTDEVCSMSSHAAKPGETKSGELSSPGAPPTNSGQLGPAAAEAAPARKAGANADGGNAWGLVVVTATLGGGIRVYQNFGMPFRIQGKGNLFY